jgi:phosphoserine phosphatase RsbU/P
MSISRWIDGQITDNNEDGSFQPLISDLMARDPVFAAPDTRIMEAAVLMTDRNIGALIVCTAGQIVGILTERDLLHAAAKGHHPDAQTVGQLMTNSPVTIAVDATWAAAAELMIKRGVRHLPVVEQGRLVGMLSVRDLMEHRNRHLHWLVQKRTAELAEKNLALEERERLMQSHLNLAGRVQRHLLPVGLPEMPSFTLALAYHPLDQVSGDYYDFAMLMSGRLGILLADASGHGVPAAFVSAIAKTAFHAYGQGIESPAAVLRIMNQRLANLMDVEHFITMFYGVLERGTRRLAYALAGHPRPLWYRGTRRTVTVLEAEGPMIGLLPEAEFEERTVQLEPDDMVLIYTDGVTECTNEQQEQFGQRRLEAFLATHGAAKTVEQLEAELTRFRGAEPFHDDVTCISLSVTA